MPAPVAREKRDSYALQGPHDNLVARTAKGCLHCQTYDIDEPLYLIEAAAADDANTDWFHGSHSS